MSIHNCVFYMSIHPLDAYISSNGTVYVYCDNSDCNAPSYVDFDEPVQHGPLEPSLHYVYSDEEIPF